MKATTSIITVLAIALMAGCGTDSGNGPGRDATTRWSVRFALHAPSETATGDTRPMNKTVIDPGAPDSITLTDGAAVIRSLRLVADGNGSVDTNITAEDKTRDQNDGSIQLKGPYVLAVDAAVNDLGSASIPPGTYRRTVFVLEPAQGVDLGADSGMAGKSLLVSGVVWRNGRGSRFDFSTDYASEFAVEGNYVLSPGASVSYSMVFAAGRWFQNGGRWIDPNDSVNRRTILTNIRRNISVEVEVTGR